MLGGETVLQACINSIGLLGSLASLMALLNELRKAKEAKITHIVVTIEGEKSLTIEGTVGEEDLEKLSELLQNVKE